MSQGQRLANADDARAGRGARRLLSAAVLGALALLALAAPASAVELLPATTLSTDANRDAACFGRDLTGAAGVVATGAGLPALPAVQAGEIEAVLHGDEASDWDVAIIDRNTGATVAASAGSASEEVAGGFLFGEEDLVVQAFQGGAPLATQG